MCEYRMVPKFDIGDAVVITSGEDEAFGTVLGRQYEHTVWWYEVYDETNEEVAMVNERCLEANRDWTGLGRDYE